MDIICILFSLPTNRYFLAVNLDLDFGSFGSGFCSRKAANSGVHQREDLWETSERDLFVGFKVVAYVGQNLERAAVPGCEYWWVVRGGRKCSDKLLNLSSKPFVEQCEWLAWASPTTRAETQRSSSVAILDRHYHEIPAANSFGHSWVILKKKPKKKWYGINDMVISEKLQAKWTGRWHFLVCFFFFFLLTMDCQVYLGYT